jgi:uncharacterized RDD family membrane protein YckC
MQYIMLTPDGKEYGPVEQDTMIEWAKSGRVTSDCQIRNALMKQWTPAEKVEFLKGLVTDPEVEAKRDETLRTKFDDFIARAHEQPEQFNRGVFKFSGAPPGLRLGAFLFDLVPIALIGTVGMSLAGKAQEAGNAMAYPLFTAGFVFAIIAYYTLSLGFQAQTIGMWFWGIMIVRAEGEPSLLFRCLLWATYGLFLLPTTVLMMFTPNNRAICDKLSGVRIVRIKVVN